MKKIAAILAFALLCIPVQAAVQTFQVTIGASATQVSTTSITCKWISIQNNAANNIRIGDSTVTSSIGIKLLPTGSFFAPPLAISGTYSNMNQWWISGTQNDVIDVTCDVVK